METCHALKGKQKKKVEKEKKKNKDAKNKLVREKSSCNFRFKI